VLARFAPPPLTPVQSKHIQGMLDVRAPRSGMLTPDGKTMFFGWNITGTFQIFRLDGPKSFPVQMTGGDEVTQLAAMAPNGRYLVVARDRHGEENPGLYLLDPKGGALRVIQHKPGIQTRFQVVSDDAKFVYYASNDKKKDSYAIYKFDVDTGLSSVVFEEDGLWNVDARDKAGRLLMSKSTGALSREYFSYDEAKKQLTPLFGQNEREEYAAFFAGDRIIVRAARAEDGKPAEFRRLFSWSSGAFAALSANVPMDVTQAYADDQGKRIYFTYNDRGYTRPRVIDAKTGKELALPKLSGDHVSIGATTRDARYTSFIVEDAQKPAVNHVYDWQKQTLVQWSVPSAPEIDTSKFAVPTLESYPARDGVAIPMFVRRPERCSGPCPVVVHFHGGPEGQSRPGFNVMGQLFVDAGFVYAEPNVRGSDGYGRSWLHADDGPKREAVITDIEDAAKFVRTAFAKDGKAPRVGIFGGSYGGYSTLMGMTKFAGAFDAGVAVVGMSNLLSFLENTAPYRRALRISEYGDPVQDKAALERLSPVTYIDRVKGPLLLIQGANDPRVPVGEALQMHAALEARGQKTQMIIFPDEGHGSQKRENKVLELGHAISFLKTHLIGPTP
jgi:dipeptidyl aminopeptidase/acylaminoacyl peptidase